MPTDVKVWHRGAEQALPQAEAISPGLEPSPGAEATVRLGGRASERRVRLPGMSGHNR